MDLENISESQQSAVHAKCTWQPCQKDKMAEGRLTDLATNFGYSFASTATIDLKLTPGDACDPASQVSVTACHLVAPDAK